MTESKQTVHKMAGYAPPPGPYVGFQPSSQPIGFEMHQPGYPPPNSGPGYPMNPPAQDIYRPTTNEYANYAKPATPSYHHHGDENADNLPPVGFEGIPSHQDPDTATASGVRLLENSSESPPPPVYHQPSDDDSHRVRMPRDKEVSSSIVIQLDQQVVIFNILAPVIVVIFLNV